ncbi:hypothetical protein OS493_003690 [Desmophyllum pertusum]|uniref:Ig-like domain-containing protein n=1 Tax=Desmophyllum pertusum TaxID=174260 RepID=A0A9X0DB38_9CNID|nr:hypothetical protein OS493_003690 [Desmophyllum pertusum]
MNGYGVRLYNTSYSDEKRRKTSQLDTCTHVCIYTEHRRNIDKRELPPANQDSSSDPNKRTDHSEKPFALYRLIDSRKRGRHVTFHLSAKEINIESPVSNLKRFVAKCSCNFRTQLKGQMFFSLLIALWMTYEVTGTSFYVPLSFSQEPTYTVARKNEDVTLNCLVQGSPPPSSITWEKDGQMIVADSRRRIRYDGALLISGVIHKRENKPDVGEYQCFASSSMGRIASPKVYLDVAAMSKKFLNEPQSTTAW